MAKLTIILGLCGSGKTHVADEIVAARGVTKFDEQFINEKRQQDQLVAALRAGNDCVLIEIWYCDEKRRTPFLEWLHTMVSDVEIEWICFENNPVKANINCSRRANKQEPASHHLDVNRRVSGLYTIPSGVEPRQIYVLPDPER